MGWTSRPWASWAIGTLPGLPHERLPTVAHCRDADGDLYGDPNLVRNDFAQPIGYIAVADDCDDANPATNPGAPEVADGVDNNCDGQIDEGFGPAPRWYRDADGDTFGDPAVMFASFTPPGGYVADNTDCDDTRADVYPGANKVCDGVDNSCNGMVDDDDPSVDAVGTGAAFFVDADRDGYGSTTIAYACAIGPGLVTNDDDCDDTAPTVFPGHRRRRRAGRRRGGGRLGSAGPDVVARRSPLGDRTERVRYGPRPDDLVGAGARAAATSASSAGFAAPQLARAPVDRARAPSAR